MTAWPFVRAFEHHEALASTSDHARARAFEDGTVLPLLVRADRQTRGRGRGLNSWWSDSGSLTFTLVLDPAAHRLRPEHEPRLALACAVAVIDAIAHEFRIGATGIRWPNDVEAGGRKLGGLLPERVETPFGSRLLIGIGLNVLTRAESAPVKVRRMAVSLIDLAPVPLPAGSPDRLLFAFLERIEPVLNRLAEDDPVLSGRWNELDLLRDQWVRVGQGPRIVEGVGRGIDPEGALLLGNGRAMSRIVGGQVLRDL